MNFREELNNIKCNALPLGIQKLLDNGLIQQCEELNDIYYITFAFRVKYGRVYNYHGVYYNDFIMSEQCNTMVCGGMALDSKLKVLRGIIYPYYSDYEQNGEVFEMSDKTKPIIMGTPQIICKKANTELKDWFSDDTFKIFNVVTDDANAWSDMVKGQEDYNNSQVYVDEDDNKIDNDEYGDGCFYGYAYLFETGKRTGCIHCYEPIIVDSRDAITLDYVSNYLNDENLTRNIAARIYCTEIISKSIKDHGNTIKDGLNNVANSNVTNGILIGKSINHIANEMCRWKYQKY